jgi:Xaa-Pro aminopeptidase
VVPSLEERPVPRAIAILGAAIVALSVSSPAARADELTTDLQARRGRVMSALDAQTMFIAWSAPLAVYSRDVNYFYRQDSNMLYLTGIDQEGAILVLIPGNEKAREVLFIREPEPKREQWTGHMLTKDEARAITGIDTVYWTSQFEPFVTAMFNRVPFGLMSRSKETHEYDHFFDAVKLGHAKLSLLFGRRPAPSEPLREPYEFARSARDRYIDVSLADATSIVEGLRQVKTAYEQQLLRRSLEISSEAHMAGMREAGPGKFEYQVQAAIEQVYLKNGAMTFSYPSIVASGPNATTLHYEASSRKMEAGELLLVDAAADYQGQSGDITRTYPVSGTFSDAQKDIYRIVQAAQEAGIKAAVVGHHTRDIEVAVEDVVRAGLVKLGLVTDATGDQFRIWYPHGICHWIGLDVHDAGDYSRPLEAGMAFTIEPGIYIRDGSLDRLPDTPENKAFQEKVRPVVKKYLNIGVRLEDSFLLTSNGAEKLSEKAPHTIEQIETFLRHQ